MYNVSESDGFALLTLKSSSPSSTEYSVEITTQDGSARGALWNFMVYNVHTYVPT